MNLIGQDDNGSHQGHSRMYASASLLVYTTIIFLLPPGFLTSRSHTIVNLCTPSFLVYRAYLKILVFPFYNAQFGCFPSHVQIPRCIKSLHASIKRKLTNACTLCMHALQLMH